MEKADTLAKVSMTVVLAGEGESILCTWAVVGTLCWAESMSVNSCSEQASASDERVGIWVLQTGRSDMQLTYTR